MVNAPTAYAYAKRRGFAPLARTPGVHAPTTPFGRGYFFVLPVCQAGTAFALSAAILWYLRLSARMSSYRMALTAPYRYP